MPFITYHISKGNIDPRVIVSSSKANYPDQPLAVDYRNIVKKNCRIISRVIVFKQPSFNFNKNFFNAIRSFGPPRSK